MRVCAIAANRQHWGAVGGGEGMTDVMDDPAGQALVMTLPTVPTRSLDAYRIPTDGAVTDEGEVS